MKNIVIKGIHMELTEAISQYVRGKVSILDKFVNEYAHVVVEVGRPSNHHKTGDDIYLAEITVDTDGQTYFVEVSDGDLYFSIDRACNEMLEIIKQGKGKRHTLLRKGQLMLKQLRRKGMYGWNK